MAGVTLILIIRKQLEMEMSSEAQPMMTTDQIRIKTRRRLRADLTRSESNFQKTTKSSS